ncbi:MAG: hypothetical protein ACREVK_07970 [Gammaproteobacteria bacterium]
MNSAPKLPELYDIRAVSRCARQYNLALIAWLGIFLLLFATGLKTLERMDRLPPPPFTATHCIDDTFRFLHGADLSDITLLAVGSSVTARSLDAGALQRHYGPGVKAINAAPCYLQMNQIAFLTDFYLKHLPHVKTVLSVFAMRDFSECASNPTEFFDVNEAGEYIFERRSLFYLYFKNFRPPRFVRSVLNPPRTERDQYGWAPFETEPDAREDVFLDQTCLAHLQRMSDKLAQRNIDFVAVLLPPMPAWLNQYDPAGARDQAYRFAVAAHVDPEHTLLIDTAKDLKLGDQHFTDPAHLQRHSVALLMQYIQRKVDQASKERPLYLAKSESAL